MAAIAVGNRVRWTSSENGEKFSYTAVVKRIDNNVTPRAFIMDVEELGVPIMVYEDDGTFEVIENSVKSSPMKNEAKIEKKQEVIAQPSTKKRKPRTNGKSKKDLAVEIVKNNLEKSRKEIIEILVKELETSPAGANTYYYLAKKELK